MRLQEKIKGIIAAIPVFLLLAQGVAGAHPTKGPNPLCNILSVTDPGNAALNKEVVTYGAYGLTGITNYSQDYPNGIGSAPTIGTMRIVRDDPFQDELITVQMEANSLRDAGDGLENAAMNLLWAEVAYSTSNGNSWYQNGSVIGAGKPMDYFTREVLSVMNSGNNKWKTYMAVTKDWAVSPGSFAYQSGEPAPNRRGTAAAGTYTTPYNYPCPYGLNCPLIDTFPKNTGAAFPTYAAGQIRCSLGGLNCNVPGFPEGGGDLLDNFPAIDPDPAAYPKITGEPVVRVNGVPGISCDIYNGTNNTGLLTHPLCAEHPDEDIVDVYDSYGIYAYNVIPGQGKAVFRHSLNSQSVVDAVFYSSVRLKWTAKLDLKSTQLSSKNVLNGTFVFHANVYDTCGNIAVGAQSPPVPTFQPTSNEAISYVGVEDAHSDMVAVDQDSLTQIRVDDPETQCSATDTLCPPIVPEGWDWVAKGTCGDAGCECCFNECAPSTCNYLGGRGSCTNVGDSGNAPGCGPEYGSNTGMLEIHDFKLSHTPTDLYLKLQTQGNILWGCYGSWYPIIGCEQWSFTTQASKFNGYGFQITNNFAKSAFYLIVVPEIPIYGSLTIFLDVEKLKSGALGNIYDGQELERYAEGGGCKKPGADPPAPDPCEEIGCDPNANASGDCDDDTFVNNTDACPCVAGGADSTDGCPPPEPPSSETKMECGSCEIEVSGNKLYIKIAKDGQIGYVMDKSYSSMAMVLSIHALDVDTLLYKACLNKYDLSSLSTDMSPRINYYEQGPVARFSPMVKLDTVPPEAPKIKACLGRCDEAVTDDGIEGDGDLASVEPDVNYRIDEGYDPTATMIELKFTEVMFNIDPYKSLLTDLSGYKIYVNRGVGTPWQLYYTVCDTGDPANCGGNSPVDRDDPSLDEPYAPNGQRFPAPVDEAGSLTGFGFPGEPVSCVIEADCDLPGNGIDDDKDGITDEGCNATNCKYDNNPALKLAEDGQTYQFKASAYDKNGNYSIFSNEATLTILRNTTPPAKPVARQAYSLQQGRSMKIAWDLNPETDMGGYNVYRCPARPVDAVKKTEDGTLAAYCGDEKNYRQVNKDIMVALKNHVMDDGQGFYEGGIGTDSDCGVGLAGDDDCDWVAATDDVGADGSAGTTDAGEGDGKPTPGEPNAYEWIDCSDVNQNNGDLAICGNMDPAWASGTPLFNTAGQRINLFDAADTARPVIIHNGLVDGYTYYYKVKAIDRPYAGDGLSVPGTCNKGLNAWQKATKQGCVNPITDVDGVLPLLTGRTCDDPLLTYDWAKGGNCSLFSDAVSGVPADTQTPPIPAGLATSGSTDGTTASLTWQMLGTDVTLDHFRVYVSNNETGPYACWHGGCETAPYTDGCKCTDTAQCNSGRTCDYPVKICTDSNFTIIPQQTSGCTGTAGTNAFSDGCVCTSDSDCLQDTCTAGKVCKLSRVACLVDGDCGSSRKCDYPYTVCLQTGVAMTVSDGIDNDGDGVIDEETPDSLDNDGDGFVDEDTGRKETITNADGSTTNLYWIGMCPAPNPDYCYDGTCTVGGGACAADTDCGPVKYKKYSSTSATLLGLTTNKTYFVKVSGVDNAVFDLSTDPYTPPNEGPQTAGVPVVPRDKVAPTAPTGGCVDAVSGKFEPCVEIDTSTSPRDDYGSRLTVIWLKNSDADIMGYYLYRAGVTKGAGEPSTSQYRKVSENITLQPTSGTDVMFKDSDLTNGMDYYYMVTAVDTHYNQSTYSEVGGPGTPKDTVPPTPPLWSPLYRIKNIGCPTVDRPANCNTEYAMDCNTGGISAEGTGDTVILQWAAHPQAVCLTDGPTEGDWRSFNVYRSDYVDVTSTCNVTPSTTCNPGFDCKVASGLTYPFYKQTTKVVAGTKYLYCLTSVDSSGNESAVSETRMITPADVTPPDAPTGLTATALVNTTIGLGWFKSSDTDIAGYKIYRSATGLEGSFAQLTSYSGASVVNIDPDGVPLSGDEKGQAVNDLKYVDDGALVTDQTYYYKITAIDSQGNESLKSDMAYAKTGPVDLSYPDRPEGLLARNGFNAGESASLRNNGADDDADGFIDDADLMGRRAEIHWTRVTNEDVAKYRIYRLDPPTIAACVCDATADPKGDCDNDLSPNVVDDCGCTPQNKTTDQFRSGYTLISEQDSTAACPATNHVRPAGTLAANSCFYVDTNPSDGLCYNDQYWYQITAVDTTGNETPLDSAFAYPGTPVQRAPQTPDKPEKPKIAVVAGGNALTVKFHQNNGTVERNKAIIGYYIYRDTKSTGSFNYKVATISDLKNLTFCDTTDLTYVCVNDISVVNGTRYFYKISAFDAYGNESELSDSNFGTPAVTLPPANAGAVSVQPDASNSYNLKVYWAPGALTTNASILGFKLLRSAATTGVWNIITPQNPTPEGYFPKNTSIYMDSGLTMGQSYCYKVITVDSLAGESTGVESCGIPGSDIFAPVPPVGLLAVAANQSVSLSWSQNSEPDLAGYNVYTSSSINGTYTRINETMLTYPYSAKGGLINDTIYWFAVTAVDKAGNESVRSAPVGAVPTLSAGSLSSISRSPEKGWNFISIPSFGAGGAVTLTRQSGKTMAGEKAYMYSSTGKDYGELALDQPFTAAPGSVLWFYNDDDSDGLKIQTQINAGSETKLSLAAGWNAVGNPFMEPVQWDDEHVKFSSDDVNYVTLGEALEAGLVVFQAVYEEGAAGSGAYRKLKTDGTEVLKSGAGFWLKVSMPLYITLTK